MAARCEIVPGSIVASSSVAALLAEAFDDDPVSSFIFASDRLRPRGLTSFFTSILERQYLRFGHVITTSDVGGAAIWGPPGMATPSTLVALAQMAPLLRWLGPKGTTRALRYLEITEGATPTQPHYYLAAIGTATAIQGMGIGSALMEHMVELIARRGQLGYLECSKASNVGFYERYGFRVTRELSLRGGPTFWTMERPVL